jgi:cytochrome c-type biogenesis protein CcmF
MIPELGHFALITALLLALVQGLVPLAGAARGNGAWMAVSVPAARAQCGFLVIAFVALTWAFVVNDFSVIYVAQHSNSALPVPYRFSAVWGAHEGSLLLWTLIIALWTMAVSFGSRNLPRAFVARVLGVLGLISAGFLLFMLFTSNPFLRQFPAPPDGGDLNPLLQDPGLVIHPPILYTGYVGFAVAFAFAIAALLGRHVDSAWARWTRPWTTAAWAFLTLGIALGSWWAYYELGWGGWWFWDPVENASFLPWLVGTALIHSLAATEKRGVFKSWTVLLAISAFSLSLLGAFLVRSGVLTSVHAFANDPARGVFILVLLAVVVGTSLLLYALRAPGTVAGGTFAPLSRETLLLANSVLLVVATIAVLLGTVYPLVIDAMGGKISVGAPYFNAVFVPLMVPLFVVLGFGVLSRWKQDEWRRIWLRARAALAGSIVLGVLIAVMLGGSGGLSVGLAAMLALWIAGATVLALMDRLLRSPGALRGRVSLPLGFVGMCLAHLGLAITIMGIAVSSHFSSELHTRMGIGDSVEMAGHRFTFAALRRLDGPNYESTKAVIEVTRNGRPVATLRTEKRFYPVRGMPMTEAGIDAGLTRDLYASLGEPLDGGDWGVRLYHKPLVRWIWLGALFMTFGGLLAASDRRYRSAEAAEVPAGGGLAAGPAARS